MTETLEIVRFKLAQLVIFSTFTSSSPSDKMAEGKNMLFLLKIWFTTEGLADSRLHCDMFSS